MVELSTALSLGVIVCVLVVTVLASLLSRTGRAQTAIVNARRHATAYLDSEYTTDPAERERIFQCLVDEKVQIIALGPKYKQMARDADGLLDLVERAHASRDAAIARGEAPADHQQ